MSDTKTQPSWLADFLNEDGTIDPQMPLCAAGTALLSYYLRRGEFGPEGPDGAAAEAIRQEAEVAAQAALDVEWERLGRAGQLLPPGGRSRTECGVRVDRPHPRRKEKAGTIMTHFPEANARYAPTIWDGWTLLQRTVVRWPDGSSYTGAWVEVEPVEADGVTA